LQPFHPPTADQLDAHLHRYAVRPASRVWLWAIVLGLPVLLILSLMMRNALVFLPLLAVIGIVLAAQWRVRKMRELERQALRVQELAMLRQHERSLRLGWTLLPQLVHLPPLHGRVVAAMAHNLDQLRCFDAAIGAYDHLVEHLHRDDPASVQFQVLRTIAQIAAERLTDADDALRRLRGSMDHFADTAVAAAYRFAQLLQQIRTHHYEQASKEADDLVAQLRPLGVHAAYGHALAALAHHELARHRGQPAPEAMRQCWSRATLLMSPQALAARYPELQPLTEIHA